MATGMCFMSFYWVVTCACQSKWVCEIARFSNDIKENEFDRLLSSVTMSVSQVVAMIVSQRKAICCTLQHRHCYQLEAEMTNVLSCQVAVGLISRFPQRSRRPETCRKFTVDHFPGLESLLFGPKYLQRKLTNSCEQAVMQLHILQGDSW